MKKFSIAAATALALALTTSVSQAESRITAQVDTKASATLSPAEQRAVSITAGRLLRHSYNARTALQAKDKRKAAAEIGKAQNLAAIIEQAVPSYTVISTITAGNLKYEDEDSVKPTIIPIYDELDKVSLMAPLRQAKADKAAKTEGKTPTEAVEGDALREMRVTLDLGLAKGGLELASANLDKDDIEGAEQALATVMDSLNFTLVEVDLPLDQARENLMLAKAAIEDGDTLEARAALTEASQLLDQFNDDANEADKAEIKSLQKEMKALSDKLEAGKSDKGFIATIEGWWDRIGKLMK